MLLDDVPVEAYNELLGFTGRSTDLYNYKREKGEYLRKGTSRLHENTTLTVGSGAVCGCAYNSAFHGGLYNFILPCFLLVHYEWMEI